MDINTKFYEDIAVKSTPYYLSLQTAFDVVNKFLIKNNRILVGGMSIDYALKLKGTKGIYGEDAIPDYDFFSDIHYRDAYDIANILYKKGIRNISVINAIHPSTIKVRVNYVTVADITYIPPKILKTIPTLNYKGILIIHPHIQMIDQHLTLTRLYQNAPREIILSGRVNKDMKRHDMLYELYPLSADLKSFKNISFNTFDLDGEKFNGQCISGIVALNYWTYYASELGYNPKYNLGEFKKTKIKNKILVSMPNVTTLVIYSNNITQLLNRLNSDGRDLGIDKNIKYFNAFVDKFPRHIEILYPPFDKVEVYDNDYFMMASPYDETPESANRPAARSLYFSNLQIIMAECLREIKFKNSNIVYNIAYLQARDIVAWAAKMYVDSKDKLYKDRLRNLLLVETYFGEVNKNMPYFASKYRFDIKNVDLRERSKLPNFKQPKAVYDKDIAKGISSNFNYDQSKIFLFDGEETEPFI